MSLIIVVALPTHKKVVVTTKTAAEVIEEFGRPIEILTQMSMIHDEEAAKRHVQMVSPKGYEVLWRIKKSRQVGGWTHSDETKEKMRQAKLGKSRDEETKLKISQTMKGKSNFEGKRHTEETKRKMALRKLNNKHAEGLFWAHNPDTDEEIRVKSRHNLPEGYVLGRKYDWHYDAIYGKIKYRRN